MKLVFSVLTAAVMAAVAGVASAAPTGVEAFTGLTPGALGSSTSTLGAGAWTEPFAGPPNATIGTGSYAGAPDSTILTLDGEDLQLLSFTATSDVPGTVGPTLYTAFALRINNRSATPANNTIDIITVTKNDSPRYFSIGLADGDLGLSYNRWFQGAQGGIILADAADATTPVLTEDDWYIVAGALTPDATGTGTSKWWIFPAGILAPLAAANGVTVAQGAGSGAVIGGVNNVQYGQKINDPFTGDFTGINVSVDQLTFFDSSLAENDFITEVRSYYGLTSVSEWALY